MDWVNEFFTCTTCSVVNMDTFVYGWMWEKCVKGDRELQNFMYHLSWHLLCTVYGTVICCSPYSLLRSRGGGLLICSYIQVLCRSTQYKLKREFCPVISVGNRSGPYHSSSFLLKVLAVASEEVCKEQQQKMFISQQLVKVIHWSIVPVLGRAKVLVLQ